ncbi:flagellar motor switch protein FliN [Vibrio sp. HA2012]|uniref:flagellar motor switch protein FliN n=1 Tax=Vibrio sp. HA2012 TaxID=1971595 RepID=UPI000C2C7BCF|nr:flagellar motor switch protein FliN [Vibrio sp. HA2012]PJC86437.1 flagellar motor switch protein FliN [Vibrio sp. HA2012]
MSNVNEQTTFHTDDLMLDELELEQFGHGGTDESDPITNTPTARDLSFFHKIPVNVTLEVSSTELSLGELLKAGEGSIIELDKLNGEPLDIKVNGSLMGHAEVVVINDKYGMRIIDVIESPLDSIGN